MRLKINEEELFYGNSNSVFKRLLGGLGMFLFGMNTMSSGLEHAAGEKLKTIIDKVTGKFV